MIRIDLLRTPLLLQQRLNLGHLFRREPRLAALVAASRHRVLLRLLGTVAPVVVSHVAPDFSADRAPRPAKFHRNRRLRLESRAYYLLRSRRPIAMA